MRIHLEHVEFIHPNTTQSGNMELSGSAKEGNVGFGLYLTPEQAEILSVEIREWLEDRKAMGIK